MDKLQFHRGDMFGTFIPGAFLLSNLLALLPNSNLLSETSKQLLSQPFRVQTAAYIPLWLLLSFVLGFFLRLVSPGLVEFSGFPVRFFVTLLWIRPKKWLMHFFNLRTQATKSSETWGELLTHDLHRAVEPFPYEDWFFNSYVAKRCGKTHRKFFKDLLSNEFKIMLGEPMNSLDGFILFNQCKLALSA